MQADLQKYVAALSRPYSKRTKAELAESLLDAVQQHRDSHVLQGEGPDPNQVQPQKQRGSEVATGGLEVKHTGCQTLAHVQTLPRPLNCPETEG